LLWFIVRSGERGVLFHDSEREQLRFVTWTEIKGFTKLVFRLPLRHMLRLFIAAGVRIKRMIRLAS
jgi:hypothetical protein